jgi:hypothetical protein
VVMIGLQVPLPHGEGFRVRAKSVIHNSG